MSSREMKREKLEAREMVLAKDRMWDSLQEGVDGRGRVWGVFLAACQPPAAALQHVNMSVARETGRACEATRSTETSVISFKFQNSGIRRFLCTDGMDPNSDATVSSVQKSNPSVVAGKYGQAMTWQLTDNETQTTGLHDGSMWR